MTHFSEIFQYDASSEAFEVKNLSQRLISPKVFVTMLVLKLLKLKI